MGRIILPVNYLVFDSGYLGPCNKEDTDQQAFIAWIRYHCPWVNVFHVTNESGTSSSAGFIEKRKRMGVTKGVSDNIILTPGHDKSFAAMELKRRDRTKSKWQEGQREFLNQVVDDGGFASVSFGLECIKNSAKLYLCGSESDDIFSSYIAQNNSRR